MRIFFIRHSNTIIDNSEPSHNWTLSKEGISRAEDLSQYIRKYEIESFYTSYQRKAMMTASIISKTNNIPLQQIEDLTELTSITNGYIDNYEEVIYKLLNNKIVRINDGESIQEGIIRFNKAIDTIVTRNLNYKNIGIISHGCILSLFCSQFSELSAYEIDRKIEMPDLAIFDWDKKEFISFFGEKND